MIVKNYNQLEVSRGPTALETEMIETEIIESHWQLQLEVPSPSTVFFLVFFY